jgi:hypothetical protein
VCVYSFIILVSCLFILGVLDPWEFSWRSEPYIFCVGLRCVECRAGTSLFGHYPGVDGGTVQIILFSGSFVAGTVRLKWWEGSVFFLSFSSVCCQFFGVRLSVVGFCSSISICSFLVLFCGFVFYKLLILLICYRWWRKSSDQEGYEPLLEQMQLEHRRQDIETRIEQLESDVRGLKDNHVMLEDGDKKDAIFSEICGLDSQIFQLKSELATVNSLLSAYD